MEYPNYRPSRDQTYMEIADVISKRGTCGRAKVGAVICIDNRIVATGFNGPPSKALHCSDEVCDINRSCSRAVHAEVNAIAFAAKVGISTEGGTLYCSFSPCISCAKLIIQAGIGRVVFNEIYDMDGINTLMESGITLTKMLPNADSSPIDKI